MMQSAKRKEEMHMKKRISVLLLAVLLTALLSTTAFADTGVGLEPGDPMPDFTVALLAEKVNTKPRHVSQVINEHYEKGFNQMLSEYRIKEACRRLVDTQGYGNLSIEGLSAGLGFKSRSNFVSNFKRIVGMSPSEYKNQSKLG